MIKQTPSGDHWIDTEQRAWVTGRDDKSAAELFEYNRDCAACFLGIGHSGDYHRQGVKSGEQLGPWAR